MLPDPHFLENPIRSDDHEFIDITGLHNDLNGELAKQLGYPVIKVKMYDYLAIQEAMEAGATSVEEAKRYLIPAYIEFAIRGGTPSMMLLRHAGGGRAELRFEVRGEPQAEVWDFAEDVMDPV